MDDALMLFSWKDDALIIDEQGHKGDEKGETYFCKPL
jgi:hypothetical protein